MADFDLFDFLNDDASRSGASTLAVLSWACVIISFFFRWILKLMGLTFPVTLTGPLLGIPLVSLLGAGLGYWGRRSEGEGGLARWGMLINLIILGLSLLALLAFFFIMPAQYRHYYF